MSNRPTNTIRTHVLPEIEDWPVYHLSQDRKQFVEQLVSFTIGQLKEKNGPEHLVDIIKKTIYLERIRVQDDPWKVDPTKDPKFWKKLQKRAFGADDGENQESILEDIVTRYAEEIVGTFKKKTFLFARKFLTLFFTRLLIAARTKSIYQVLGSRHRLSDRMIVKGEIEPIRSLMKKGILVIVPTHFSNLDSILIGYAIDTFVGLPSFAYGAGLNLYNSGIAAYYMNRLGAYRVDRRKKNSIYLETLKGMSTLSLERGVNSLFFADGTRSRSGSIQTNLKLGLLGTVVEAQRKLLQAGDDRKIFVVPLILSYHFVLEARYLIDQYLLRQGKEQYLRVKDDFNSIRKILNFAWHSFSQTSDIYLSFGQPMDVVGNYVDENGHSFDQLGNPVALREYFMSGNELNVDYQRESVYTQMLGDQISDRYLKDNIVLASHLTAFAAFEMLKYHNSKLDLYGLLQLPVEDWEFDEAELLNVVDQLKAILFKMEREGNIKLSDAIQMNSKELIKDGMKRLGSYHGKKPIKYNRKGRIVSDNFKLLYYYHNRLNNYQLDQQIKWT